MENTLIQMLGNAVENIKLFHIICIVIVLIVVIAACIVLSVLHKRLQSKIVTSNDIRRTHIYTSVFRIIRIAVILGGILAVMSLLGIDTSGAAIGISTILVLFILSIKDSFQDFFAGFTIMFDKYFSVGDAVEFEGRDGMVISFTMRTTKIKCLDDQSVISISNRHITKIRKLTHLVDIDLPLSYDEDVKRVYQVLEGICQKAGELDGVELCQFKGTQGFSDCAVIYKIRFFCDPENRPDIRRAVIKTIQNGLDEAGIHIPYPQLDIHQKTVSR